MCGICGLVRADAAPVSEAILRPMNDCIIHRGPDGDGYHTGAGIGLAMRRLSIIDVAGSDQPLYNEDQQIALVFNGEIFNYRALRQHLSERGHTLRTAGDGETITHLYEDYGLAALDHLRGQFAFALWDAREQRLVLARDRFGQKPLYYTQTPNGLLFASEIKSLLAHPAITAQSRFESDPALLARFLAYGYVPAPDTAFVGIHALLPGHYAIYERGTLKTAAYWQPPTISAETHTSNLETYLEATRAALREAVELRLLSDVPLGAFLSGGLDSSLIVALMQEISNQQAKTFSIGFSGDDSFDETPYAAQVADYLGSDHTAFTVEPHALDLLEKLVWHHDQPFADSSAIPTFLVSELTRQHVTVALTGDGGDELFAGYERFYAASLVQRLNVIPRPLWRFLAAVIGLLPEGTGYYNVVKRAGRFARGASQPLTAAYFDWIRVASAEQVAALSGQHDRSADHFRDQYVPSADLAGILHANQTSYLPDDLLIKADRCSMAASLEARAPFLDHHLAETVAPMPLSLKLRGSTTKYLLKEAARGTLPDSIIDRPKHGFGVPLAAWLRADISPVRDLLLSDSARRRGLLNMAQVEMLIDEHHKGGRDHNRLLWTLLTLEQWHRVFFVDGGL